MEFISKSRTLGRENKSIKFQSVAVMVLGSFLISRVCFFDQMLPAGIALITILVSLNKLNFYLLPVVLLGTITFHGTGLLVWGDMGAALGCAIVFLLTSKVHFELWQKAAIAGATSIIANSIYYTAAGNMPDTPMENLIIEGIFVVILCLVFSGFFQMTEKAGTTVAFGTGLVIATFVAMLAVAGAGQFVILLPCALILTIFAGYTMGVMEGVTVALTAGTLLLLCGENVSAVMVLALGGIVAGLCRGQKKAVAAACFAAVTIGAGMLNTSTGLSIPFFGPLIAAAIMILVPQRWMEEADIAVSKFLGSKAYQEKKRRSQTVDKLEDIKQTFDELSALFTSAENQRAGLSYQFKGVSQALMGIMKELGQAQTVDSKYSVEQAWSGYARNLGVSGDSYLWEDLEDGRFAIVLSDGMGKGQQAAAESSLVVNSVIKLLKAGLEVELVLKILNSILLLDSGREIFSTVDLGILNKKTGKMKFYKIGAATTFVKRKDSIETVKVSAMPLGIIDGLKVDYVTVTLRPGDQVIMISDGVTDSKREDLAMNWLIDTAMDIKSKDPQTMCDLIMNKAVENYGLKEKDDLTVLTVRMI